MIKLIVYGALIYGAYAIGLFHVLWIMMLTFVGSVI